MRGGLIHGVTEVLRERWTYLRGTIREGGWRKYGSLIHIISNYQIRSTG